MRILLALIVLASLWLSVASASAMDRWAALSMLETGDNDKATGPGGEISRFQIQPVLWPGGNPQDPHDALIAAQEIMHVRLDGFEKSHKRPATDFEFYVLWNAPSRIEHPPLRVAERATRFANLVRRTEVQPQTTNSPPGAGTNAP